MPMLPEEKARVKIDKQLRNAGWDIVARNEYLPNSTSAVMEALMGVVLCQDSIKKETDFCYRERIWRIQGSVGISRRKDRGR